MSGLVDVVTTPERRRAYEAAGLWDDSTLSARVAALVASRAGDVAVVDRGGTRRKTYGELGADAEGLKAFLAGAGVGAGDVVSIQLPNTYEAAVAAVAVQGLGAVSNPLLPIYRRKELSYVFETVAPKVVFTPAVYRGFDHRSLIDEVVAATGHRPEHVVVDEDHPLPFVRISPFAERRDPHERDSGDVSEVIFTSGTEAAPKAIMHTERTAGFSMRVAYADLGLTPDDVVWMPSPVGHSTGFNYGLRFALYHGLRLVLQDQWDPSVAVELIDREGCTYTLAATTFLQDLVSEAERTGTKLSSMRYFGCGGAPVPPELVRAADEVAIGVLRLYGSTEVLVATWNRPDSPLEKKMHTDGLAMSHVDVELRGGEIHTRGPNTSVGLFDDPERTASTCLEDGWVRSGDLATMDGDGYISIVGRKKEIIIRGGVNIAPREIEELLLRFPEVERAAVVGLPDERLGERSCACLVLRPGASIDLDTTVARLREVGLATYKLPERLEILEALPTTASGKVQKHEIVRGLLGDG